MPGLPSGRVDLVVPDGDPRVLVGDPPACGPRHRTGPRPSPHRRTRDGRRRRRRPTRPLDSGRDDADDRTASEPRFDVRRRLGRPHPGARRRRAVRQHLAAGRRRPERPGVPGHPRDDPVRQGQLAPRRRHDAGRVVRRARLRAVPRRRPRHGVVGRRRPRRVHGGRDARRVRRRRVAGRPAVVHGHVGMWGISYGGFTAIQVAKLRPPHLRAIVPVMATDDRYLDDVHYRGGCVTVSELSQYAVSQVAMNAMPPDAGVPRRRLARRLAGAARGDAAMAVRLARAPDRRAVLAAGLARARLRRDRGGDLQHRRLERFVRRSGVPDAGALHGAVAHARRQLGPRVAASTPRPGPNLDELHEIARFFDRRLAASPNGWDEEPAGRLVRARLRAARAVPGRRAGAVAGGRRPTRIPRRRSVHWRFEGGGAARGTARATRGPVAPASTRSGTGRRPGRAAPLSWGAGGRPTASPATCGRTRRRARRTRARPRGAARRAGRAGGRRPPRGRRAGRDRRRPAVRRGARRDLGARERRGPEPHPPPVARRTRSRSGPGAVEESASPLRTPAIAWQPGHRDPGRDRVVGRGR